MGFPEVGSMGFCEGGERRKGSEMTEVKNRPVTIPANIQTIRNAMNSHPTIVLWIWRDMMRGSCNTNNLPDHLQWPAPFPVWDGEPRWGSPMGNQ
jgi:hypothetical protein